MEPEEEMEIITDFIMRNRLMETFDEVHHLERLLKEAKERLKNEMDRRRIIARWALKKSSMDFTLRSHIIR